MKILLLSATQHEIEPFLHKQELLKKCDVLITGVGIPATTYHLTRHLHHHHYDLVIQAGLAGTFTTANNLGDVILVTKDAFGDVGAYEQQQIKSLTDMELSYELEWLVNDHGLLQQLPYKKAAGITVSTVTDDKNMIKALQQKWNADIETMEGAVLHYVCLHLHKPYIQLRSISNFAGERDKEKWKMKEAIENLNNALAGIINNC